jgi:hypothetical protein
MKNSTDKPSKGKAHDDVERDLNLKIIEVTTRIKEHYPQLTKFLEEMPIAVTEEKNVDVTLMNLRSYYDSLNTMLNKYISEQPDNSNQPQFIN